MRKLLLLTQGSFYCFTGIWPLMHMPSFLRVTGPKNEVWLVVAVGFLVLSIGAALVCSALQARRERSIDLLALFAALGLGAVDVRYATRQVIQDIYLLDAAVEGALVLTWFWVFWRSVTNTHPEKR